MDLEAFVQEQTSLKKKHSIEREEEEEHADKTEAEELERLRQVCLENGKGGGSICTHSKRIRPAVQKV